MMLIQPDDLASFESKLSSARLAEIGSALRSEHTRLQKIVLGTSEDDCGTYPYSLKVFMPKFGLETRADLVKVLERLGMATALKPGADFTGIARERPLYISKVVHQANIDVDETGTEAAAATAVGGDTSGGCGGPQPRAEPTLRLDRPFLFVLHDVKTGAILFMGRVIDPSTKS